MCTWNVTTVSNHLRVTTENSGRHVSLHFWYSKSVQYLITNSSKYLFIGFELQTKSWKLNKTGIRWNHQLQWHILSVRFLLIPFVCPDLKWAIWFYFYCRTKNCNTGLKLTWGVDNYNFLSSFQWDNSYRAISAYRNLWMCMSYSCCGYLQPVWHFRPLVVVILPTMSALTSTTPVL